MSLMNISSVLAFLGFFGLVTCLPGQNIRVHVVSNQNSIGGNCLMVNYFPSCSNIKATSFHDFRAFSFTDVGIDYSSRYGIGFSNKCPAKIVVTCEIEIVWSKLTTQKAVWFHDDQCFWTTQDESGKIFKDEKGVPLCFKDQQNHGCRRVQSSNPFEKPLTNTNQGAHEGKSGPWPYPPECNIPTYEDNEQRKTDAHDTGMVSQAADFQEPDSSTMNPEQNNYLPTNAPISEDGQALELLPSSPNKIGAYQATTFDEDPPNGKDLISQGAEVEPDMLQDSDKFAAGFVDNNSPLTYQKTEDFGQESIIDNQMGKRNLFSRRFMA